MAIRDKTQLNSSKFINKSPLQNNAHKHRFNPNYYPLVARVDSKVDSFLQSWNKLLQDLKKQFNLFRSIEA